MESAILLAISFRGLENEGMQLQEDIDNWWTNDTREVKKCKSGGFVNHHEGQGVKVIVVFDQL